MMHDRAETINALPRVLRLPIPDPPVQSVNLRDDHDLRRREGGIASRQPRRDLFHVVKSHSDVEPAENWLYRDASFSENAPKPRTTAGERRQHSVPGSSNRVEVLPSQPDDVSASFCDAPKT